MKRFLQTTLALVATGLISSALVGPEAQAVPITGGISLGGAYSTNTGNLNTATAFTSFSNVFVTSVSGSYSTVGTGQMSPTVTQNGFQFNPFVGPVVPLWTFTSGGLTYSFDLTAITQRTQPGDDTLDLRGFGILRITGGTSNFDPTVGSWVFTANQQGGTFSFSSSNGALPEGGMTVVMLGLALGGIGMVRRKLAKS
jgi:hypothetical protein